jgi:hypothetical protein
MIHLIAKPTLIIAVLSSALFLRCSSQGGQEQGEEPVNGTDQLDQQEDETENASLNGSGAAAQQGAQMNNAVDEEFAQENNAGNAGNNLNSGSNFVGANNGNSSNNLLTNNFGNNPMAEVGPTNVPLNQSTPLNTVPTNVANTPLNQAIPMNNAAPTNIAPSNSAALPAAASSAPTVSFDKMNASPFTNGQMNWPGRGKVKYITRRVTKHAGPDGAVVGELDVGDHPLIYQNGNWVELSNGTFIKGNATTDRGVGYQKGPARAYSH